MSQLTAKQVVENFWSAMQTNDFSVAAGWLSGNYVGDWMLSNERILGRENFIAINSAYPSKGKWKFKVNRLVVEQNQVVTEVDVTDGSVSARVVTFHTIQHNQICKQVEYWVEEYPAQEWRKQWVVPIH